MRTSGFQDVGALRAAGRGIGAVLGNGDVEEPSALQGGNAVQLPSAEGELQRLVAAGEERQVVDIAGDEAVAEIPIGTAVVKPPIVGMHGCATAVGIR